ncbi:hypothetical protein BLA29_009450 [Euroglyphus maynei]|uniref:Uncharacterized protein n=1 Tax=Euroglyphus maynei TaxID=6958 RepID=A0A1Y3AUC2_EURMA|nr:hypothetical protein BLA29_009450 [Euroglyphus maynei]
MFQILCMCSSNSIYNRPAFTWELYYLAVNPFVSMPPFLFDDDNDDYHNDMRNNVIFENFD